MLEAVAVEEWRKQQQMTFPPWVVLLSRWWPMEVVVGAEEWAAVDRAGATTA